MLKHAPPLRSLLLFVLALVTLGPADAAANVDELVGSGEEYYRNGLYQKAVMDFNRAMQADPKSLAAAKGLGKSAMQTQDWNNARRGWDAAHRLSPGDCDITKNLAYVYLALGTQERSRQYYEEVIGTPGKPGCDPDDNFSKSNLATLYYRSQDDALEAKAIQLYNQVLNSGEEDENTLYRTYYALGDLYKQRKNNDLALENFEKAFAIKPDKTEGRLSIGLIYFNKQEYEKAIENLMIAYESDPNNYKLNLMLGLSYDEMSGHQDEAIQYLAKSVNLIRLMPDNKKPSKNLPHRTLANLYNKQNNPREAIKVSKEGLELSASASDRAGLTCTLAKAYEKQKKYEEALELFESVIDDPQWGAYANKQAERQENLIQRREASSGN